MIFRCPACRVTFEPTTPPTPYAQRTRCACGALAYRQEPPDPPASPLDPSSATAHEPQMANRHLII